jgi:hypothetical protein
VTASFKAIPVGVHRAAQSFVDDGKPFALIIILDDSLYVEASAKTAVVFERLLKGWTAETMPTLYRSNLRTFLVLKGEVKEVTLTRIKTILK